MSLPLLKLTVMLYMCGWYINLVDKVGSSNLKIAAFSRLMFVAVYMKIRDTSLRERVMNVN